MVEEEDEEVSEVEVEEIKMGTEVPIQLQVPQENNKVPRMIISPSKTMTIRMMIGIHPKLYVTIVVELGITSMGVQ